MQNMIGTSHYSDLNDTLVQRFDEYYSEKPHLMKRHKKDFEKNIDKYFYKANDILVENSNEFIYLINDKGRYDYDSNFSYLEREDNLLILYVYHYSYLSSLLFYELDTDNYYGYTQQSFKYTNINLMLNPNYKGTYYSDDWVKFYNHYQRLKDDNSLNILRSLDRFKYIPLDKFDKINYFLLLTATNHDIYCYEMLLKIGATKIATGLFLDRRNIDKVTFKRKEAILKQNRSYKYYLDSFNLRSNVFKNISDTDYDLIINDTKKLLTNNWEYKDYIVKLPDNLHEVNKEANILQHCLYSNKRLYFQKVESRDALILFLRRKENVDEPFFTIELNKNGFEQVRTKNNQTDTNISLIAEEWLSNNRLEIDRYFGI